MKSHRENILVRASWVAILGNALLSVMKISVGLWANSMAVLADGIDSATDIVTSFVTLVTARIVSRPPDMKHPYGYQKADAVASKVLSVVIFFAGLQLAWSALEQLIEGHEPVMPGVLALWVTLVSIAGKLGLMAYLYMTGQKTGSSMLRANAANMRNDVFISVGVLVGLAFAFLLDMPWADPVMALLVSVMIFKSAIEIFMETNRELMDGVADTKLYPKVKEAICSVGKATNPHRIRIRKTGYMHVVELDIEVDGSISVHEGHEIAVSVEKAIRKQVENIYDVIVHIEPKGNKENERYGVSGSDIR
jgi:cation diffusion facilitator family transporter